MRVVGCFLSRYFQFKRKFVNSEFIILIIFSLIISGGQNIAQANDFVNDLSECNDGIDNDQDGTIDFAGHGIIDADLNCTSPEDDSESSAADGYIGDEDPPGPRVPRDPLPVEGEVTPGPDVDGIGWDIDIEEEFTEADLAANGDPFVPQLLEEQLNKEPKPEPNKGNNLTGVDNFDLMLGMGDVPPWDMKDKPKKWGLKRVSKYTPGKTNIIIIPGFNWEHDDKDLVEFIKKLIEQGYNVFIYAWDDSLEADDDSEDPQAEALDKVVDQLNAELTKYGFSGAEFVVVSHSMGTTVSDYAVLRADKDLYKNADIIKAGPIHGGSDWADVCGAEETADATNSLCPFTNMYQQAIADPRGVIQKFISYISNRATIKSKIRSYKTFLVPDDSHNPDKGEETQEYWDNFVRCNGDDPVVLSGKDMDHSEALSKGADEIIIHIGIVTGKIEPAYYPPPRH